MMEDRSYKIVRRAICTPGVTRRAEGDMKFSMFLRKCHMRHINGDWGNICEADKEVNRCYPGEELSVYEYDDGTVIWIKSENGIETILYPSEY